MDSYEYYLLFHKDSTQFFSCFSENDQEILIALEKLLENDKIQYVSEKDLCFTNVWSMIQNEKVSTDRLDSIFEVLLTDNRIEVVSYWILDNLKNFETIKNDQVKSVNLFRIIRVLTRVLKSTSENTEYLKTMSNLLMDIMTESNSNFTYMIVAILKSLINEKKKNDEVSGLILSEIYSRMSSCKDDKYSQQNLCNFFNDICDRNLLVDNLQTLLRFFTSSSDQLSRKQGVFVIKTLIHHKKLIAEDEESFKRFTIVVETLEENQSHLILPVLELIEDIKFSDDFECFWFILCGMIIKHDNCLVRNWGINYLTKQQTRKFNNANITEILCALNSTTFYDPDDKQLNIEDLGKFMDRNFVRAFHCLSDVNWISVPFYRVLEMIVGNIEKLQDFDDLFMIDLNQQTDVIPKRIKNFTIRAGVQGLYSRIIAHFIKIKNFNFHSALFVQTILRILEIGRNREMLGNALKCSGDKIYELIRDDLPEDLVAFVLSTICNSKKETENYAKKLKNCDSIVRKAICYLNESSKSSMKLQESIIEDEETFMSTDAFLLIPPQELLRMKNFYLNTADDQKTLKIILDRLEELVDDCGDENTIEIILKILKGLCEKVFKHLLTEDIECEFFEIFNKTFSYILRSDNRKSFIWRFLEVLLITCEVRKNISILWNEKIVILIYSIFEQSSGAEKSLNFQVILDFIEKSDIFHPIGVLRDLAKKLLIDKILETEIPTRDQQIESFICGEIESSQGYIELNMSVEDRKRQRLRAALILSSLYGDELDELVELYMEDFHKASKRKPSYFLNSWIHRWKLHCLQPILFCHQISQRNVEILLHELLYINNQLSVTYLIEIILAKHYPNIINLLDDEKLVLSLKAPALKSIFVVAVMQRKSEDSFTLLEENFLGIAEVKLQILHDMLMPFTMGHNYGVRSYAQAAIIVLYQHVRSIFGTRDTQKMQGISQTCATIQKSLIFKNAGRLFEVLKQDFRFSLKFDQIWTIDIFYNHIPAVTRMTFEDIISPGNFDTQIGYFKRIDREIVKIAEMEPLGDFNVVTDEIAVPKLDINQQETSLNLQQKYLPYKFQVPSAKLRREIIPRVFKNDEEKNSLSIKPDSNLVVVASLIDRAPNLGGLARTCEIFGAENYVIESLKLIDNSEFKALSMTAEKWMKISEVKHWQLFDFLLGMKQKGYTIIGAEQSGKSASLINTKIPKKSVMLLGHEKEGIPANLLSLLDITIEIPQLGFVRSLNVHVTGAIVIWEYAKQHLFKK